LEPPTVLFSGDPSPRGTPTARRTA
jgi:hypothetical protein